MDFIGGDVHLGDGNLEPEVYERLDDRQELVARRGFEKHVRLQADTVDGNAVVDQALHEVVEGVELVTGSLDEILVQEQLGVGVFTMSTVRAGESGCQRGSDRLDGEPRNDCVEDSKAKHETMTWASQNAAVTPPVHHRFERPLRTLRPRNSRLNYAQNFRELLVTTVVGGRH